MEGEQKSLCGGFSIAWCLFPLGRAALGAAHLPPVVRSQDRVRGPIRPPGPVIALHPAHVGQ